MKATSFLTDGLSVRDEAGHRTFRDPDLSSFSKELVAVAGPGGFDGYFIVQATTPEDQLHLRRWLRTQGIAILDYIPQNAYLVRLGVAGLRALSDRPEVVWLGPFQPAYRVDPAVDYVIEANPYHQMRIRVLFDARLWQNEGTLRAALSGIETTVLDVSAGPNTWIVRLDGAAAAARQIVLVPGCLWIERYVPFELLNNIARTSSSVATGRGSQSGPIMDVENVWAKGIHGEGQIASAADTGLSTGNLATLHQDFGNQSDPNNPMRVRTTWALGRTNDWSDDGSIGGGHGTHTSGSILGNGFRSGSTPSTNTFPTTSYAGIAPQAQYDFQSVMDSSGNLGGLPADLNNLFQPPYNDGARVHSNSWGAAVAGSYNADAQYVDQFAWNNKDMVITFSAGNSGTDSNRDGIVNADSVGSPGTAKDCITVGASENYRPDYQFGYGTTAEICQPGPTWGWGWSTSFPTDPIYSDLMADNANGMGAFSSRGPCKDSRIKPDIVAPGIAIISTRTDMNPDPTEQWGDCNLASSLKPYYLSMGGTSMANPLTAGSAVLVRQYYGDGWHPNNSQTTNASANGPDGFNPSSALVKATLINGAWDMAPGQYGTGSTKEIPPSWDTGHDLPNNVEGYGRVDLMHSLFPGQGWGDDAGRRMEVHDVTPGLQTGQYHTYSVAVASNANPLIVTLVWTDPYGAISAGTELVNNLDLTVTAPGGTVYYPNGLNKTSGADSKNNVEQVKVTSPASGSWIAKVNGTGVPGNGVAGTTTQPYALVISGVLTPPCTPPGAPTLDSATGDCNGVNLAWTAGSGTTGSYNVYRSTATSCPVGTLTKIAGPITSTTYADMTALAGTTYTYVVRGACDAAGTTESADSNCLAGARLGPPSIVYLAHGVLTPIDTNGDGVMEAGERYSVQVTVQNTGAAEATNVTASLSAMPGGNGILVCNNPGGFGTMAPGATASYTYTFVVDPAKWYSAYSCGSNLTFNVVSKSAASACACSCNDEMAVFSSQVGAAGGIVTLFGPDDMANLGNWTASGGGATIQTTPHCSPSSAYARIAGGTSGGAITLKTAVSTVGLTNITVVFDYDLSSTNNGTRCRLDWSPDNGTTWMNGAFTGSSTSWLCGNSVALPSGAAGVSQLKIRFTNPGTSGNRYANVDYVGITGTSAGTCGTWTAACSAKPLKVPYSVTPMKITTANQGTDGTVEWDATNCASTNYHLIYGKGENLASWTVDGAECTLGTSGSYGWSNIPDPSSYASRFLWFLVVGGDGGGTEGSWGVTYPSGTEEGGATASGQCSCTTKDTSVSCATP